MRYEIHAGNVKVSSAFTGYVEDRMQRLLSDFAFIVSGDLYLHELGTKSPAHQVRFRVQVPGETLVVEERGNNFQEAFDAALSAMRRQLTRYKETIRS